MAVAPPLVRSCNTTFVVMMLSIAVISLIWVGTALVYIFSEVPAVVQRVWGKKRIASWPHREALESLKTSLNGQRHSQVNCILFDYWRHISDEFLVVVWNGLYIRYTPIMALTGRFPLFRGKFRRRGVIFIFCITSFPRPWLHRQHADASIYELLRSYMGIYLPSSN